MLLTQISTPTPPRPVATKSCKAKQPATVAPFPSSISGDTQPHGATPLPHFIINQLRDATPLPHSVIDQMCSTTPLPVSIVDGKSQPQPPHQQQTDPSGPDNADGCVVETQEDEVDDEGGQSESEGGTLTQTSKFESPLAQTNPWLQVCIQYRRLGNR